MRLIWCEQSGLLADRTSVRATLQRRGHSFFRYNWKHGAHDPFANLSSPERLSWSKGRELLLSRALQEARDDDYILMLDDDVEFAAGLDIALAQLESKLREFKPLFACLGSANWHHELVEKFSAIYDPPVARVFLADLEVQIVSAALARHLVPVPFDGGYGTLWHFALVAHRIRSSAVLCFRHVKIRNTRSEAGGEYGGDPHLSIDRIWRACAPIISPEWRYLSRFAKLQPFIKWTNLWFLLLGAAAGVRPNSHPAPRDKPDWLQQWLDRMCSKHLN